jgi:hypothetical protein
MSSFHHDQVSRFPSVNLKTAILKEIIPNYWHFSLEYTKDMPSTFPKIHSKAAALADGFGFSESQAGLKPWSGRDFGPAWLGLIRPGLAWPGPRLEAGPWTSIKSQFCLRT